MKILVADDDTTITNAVVNLGKKCGVDVEAVPDGKDAIDKCTSGAAYDIIFMDVYMDNIGGIEATKQIRALGNGSSYVIILMSADDYDIEEVKKLGFDEYQKKPVKKSEFEKWVEKYKK